MNYVSESATCGDDACVACAPRPVRVSSGRSRSTRRHSLADAPPIESRQPLLQNRQWEKVQEMFVASRSRFVGLAYSVLRNQEDAEDAVQNATLSAYLHLRDFEGRSAFTTWFTRIVFNAALMIRRSRKPNRIQPFPDFDSANQIPWNEGIPSRQPDPEMACAEAETFRRVDALLAKMSPMLRQAFTMVYYDELSVEEAGALLGVTASTFKSRVFRARRQLVSKTRRSLVAPIRSATRMLASMGSNSYATVPERSSEMPSREVAFR